MVQRKYFLKFFNPLSEFKGSLQMFTAKDVLGFVEQRLNTIKRSLVWQWPGLNSA
jgi:hypothetical protein